MKRFNLGHLVGTLFVFLALLSLAFLFGGGNTPVVPQGMGQLIHPVSIDVCSQSVPQNYSGMYQSQGCVRDVNHSADYYYYGTVNSPFGTYTPNLKK